MIRYHELSIDAIIIKQPPTGSCFYHGVLYALYSEYREREDKMNMVEKFRRKIALMVHSRPEYLNNDKYIHYEESIKLERSNAYRRIISKLSKNEILERGRELDNSLPDHILKGSLQKLFMYAGYEGLKGLSFPSQKGEGVRDELIKTLRNVRAYANEVSVYLVEKFLNINILIVDRATHKLMIRPDTYIPGKPSIILSIVKDVHYDLIGCTEGAEGVEGVKLWFDHDDPFLEYTRSRV